MKKLRRLRKRITKALKATPKSLKKVRKKLAAARKIVTKRIKARKRKTTQHKVIPRSTWGARSPSSVSRMTSTANGVFIHHTVGPQPSTQAGEVQEMQAIQNYHMNSQGWNDIGYSFVIAPSGRIYEGRGKGVAGAHTAGYNSSSYGVSFMGNFEIVQPTKAALDAAKWLRRTHLKLGSKPIRGHRDAQGNATACPGRNLYSKLNKL